MNTERSLRALFEAFVAAPHDTHHGPNLVAAVFAYARRRPATVEAWEDGPVGAGMSDRVMCRADDLRLRDIDEMDARITAAIEAARERPPAAEEPSGRTTEAQDGRGVLAGTGADPTCRCGETPLANPHPITPPRGEHKPLPMTGGITHGDGSPIAAKHSGPSDRCVPRFKPVDPTIAAEDSA